MTTTFRPALISASDVSDGTRDVLVVMESTTPLGRSISCRFRDPENSSETNATERARLINRAEAYLIAAAAAID